MLFLYGFAFAMFIGYLFAKHSYQAKRSAATGGELFRVPAMIAFEAGLLDQPENAPSWLGLVMATHQSPPHLRAAAVNACHYAFEMGRTVRSGSVDRNTGVAMCAREMARQLLYAAEHRKPLPPLRFDVTAAPPPTLNP